MMGTPAVCQRIIPGKTDRQCLEHCVLPIGGRIQNGLFFYIYIKMSWNWCCAPIIYRFPCLDLTPSTAVSRRCLYLSLWSAAGPGSLLAISTQTDRAPACVALSVVATLPVSAHWPTTTLLIALAC